MSGFDVLDPALDLYQSRFIEASAGTGKTFAIENIVTRLLQDGVELERILIVTFTRAATLDLKMRIRSNIAKHNLLEALGKFDEAKIFTIHSFCFHALREHALEANLPLDQEEESAEHELRMLVKEHLRTLEGFSPKQLEKVLRKGVETLVTAIVRLASDRIPIEAGAPYDVLVERLRALPFDREALFSIAPYFAKVCNRQKEVKEEVRAGLEAFCACMEGEERDLVDSPLLLMQRKNLLKRAPEIDFSFLDRALPLLEEISDELHILGRISEGARKKIEQNSPLSFEDLLRRMDAQVQKRAFAEKIRAQYDVILIDEFQDTNPLQWRIFKTLFLDKTLYLVGDPKQAIYRFRHADIYTYLEAKRAFARCERLETNYRSTPTLVQQLNALFASVPDLIALPRTQQTLPCPPVKWDEKKEDGGGIEVIEGESEEALFSAILHKAEPPFSSNAILVKDRYQAERFLTFAHACGFPAVSRRARSLLDSPAFPALRALLYAVLNPREREGVLRVLGGPLYALPVEELHQEHPFFRYHRLLEEQGLLSFFHSWKEDQGAALIARDEALFLDLQQLIEQVAEARVESAHLLPYLETLREEELLAQQSEDAEALVVLTTHVSKGLEFETVFPIGLTLPSPRRREFVVQNGRYVLHEEALKQHHAELDAEEMRQLYVAFTRAKKRLYILTLAEGKGVINRFLERACCEKTPFTLPPPPPPVKEEKRLTPPEEHIRCDPPLFLHSFSSLYPHRGRALEQKPTLPAGAEIGTALHTLFETLPFHAFEEHFEEALAGTLLEGYRDEVFALVKRALTTPLPQIGCSLAQIDPRKIVKEMEFLYSIENGLMKGFIDLFFEHEGCYYLLDWKSNVVEEPLAQLMERFHYDKQAEIYREAATRYLHFLGKKGPSGIFYLFLRKEEGVVFTPADEIALDFKFFWRDNQRHKKPGS